MTTHIEKVAPFDDGRRQDQQRTGLIDFIFNPHWKHDYFDFNASVSSQATRQTFLDQFADKVSLGSLEGLIDHKQVMQCNKDTVLDMSITVFLEYPPTELAEVLKVYRVTITDWEEGTLGQEFFAYKNFIDKVIKIKVIPRELIYLSFNFGLKGVPSLNIKTITVPFWLMVTAWDCPWIVKSWDDSHYCNSLLGKIYTSKRYKTAMFPNYKARPVRLFTLALMDEANLLDKTDWSLVGKQGNTTWDEKFSTVGLKNNKEFNTKVNSFLEKRKEELPKHLPKLGSGVMSFTNFPEEYIGTYDWSITIETLPGLRVPYANGVFGGVTEKVFKCFAVGTMPLMISESGTEKYLNSIGFKVHSTGTDNMRNFERARGIVDYFKHIQDNNIKPNIDDVMHNAKLMVDKEFLCSKITGPILEYFNG
jgi:hypothetical protein